MQRPIDGGAGVDDRTPATPTRRRAGPPDGDGNGVVGGTWGFAAKEVWVADGCRGTFAMSTRDTATCSAVAGAREVGEAKPQPG